METWVHERFGVCGWYCRVLLSVHIDVVWCGYNGLRFMYVCTVCIPRWKYPSSIHQVSIPHIQYNTYIYIPITALHTQCNLNTYALPAYQPDDSPLPPVRSSRHNREKQNNQNPQQAACPLAEAGVNRHGKRATKLLYKKTSGVWCSVFSVVSLV